MAVPLSASRSRRLREAATKKTLYKRSQGNGADKIDVLVQHVQELASLMHSVAACVTGFHGYHVAEGVWDCKPQYDHTAEFNCWANPSCEVLPSDDRQMEQAGDIRHTTSVPYVLWLPGSKNFIGENTRLEQELKVEAAITLQRYFRQWSACKNCSQSSDTSSIESKACATCGLAFATSQLDENYTDRYDTCDSYVHSGCLSSYHDGQGDWHVCVQCRARRPRDDDLLVEGLRSELQAKSPAKEHHHPKTPEQEHILSTSSGAIASEANAGMNKFKELDQCLEYTVMFLEGKHVKSHLLSKDVHDQVLGHIKSTISWKDPSRTPEEIASKATQTNSMPT